MIRTGMEASGTSMAVGIGVGTRVGVGTLGAASQQKGPNSGSEGRRGEARPSLPKGPWHQGVTPGGVGSGPGIKPFGGRRVSLSRPRAPGVGRTSPLLSLAPLLVFLMLMGVIWSS